MFSVQYFGRSVIYMFKVWKYAFTTIILAFITFYVNSTALCSLQDNIKS